MNGHPNLTAPYQNNPFTVLGGATSPQKQSLQPPGTNSYSQVPNIRIPYNQQSGFNPSSSNRSPRKSRSPIKAQVQINHDTIRSNPQYDSKDLIKSALHHDEAKRLTPRNKTPQPGEFPVAPVAVHYPKSFEKFTAQVEQTPQQPVEIMSVKLEPHDYVKERPPISSFPSEERTTRSALPPTQIEQKPPTPTPTASIPPPPVLSSVQTQALQLLPSPRRGPTITSSPISPIYIQPRPSSPSRSPPKQPFDADRPIITTSPIPSMLFNNTPKQHPLYVTSISPVSVKGKPVPQFSTSTFSQINISSPKKASPRPSPAEPSPPPQHKPLESSSFPSLVLISPPRSKRPEPVLTSPREVPLPASTPDTLVTSNLQTMTSAPAPQRSPTPLTTSNPQSIVNPQPVPLTPKTPSARIALIQPLKDTTLDNPVAFFSSPSITAIPVPLASHCKLDASSSGQSLYLAGKEGSCTIGQSLGKWTLGSENRDSPYAQIKVSKVLPEVIYLQEGNTNNMLVYSSSLEYLGKIGNGVMEPGELKQEFKHFRHSLDDNFLLWRTGGPNMAILDLNKRQVDEVVEKFWGDNPESKPIAAVSTIDANRILGASILEGDSILHFYEKSEPAILISEKAKKIIDHNISSINSIEVNSNGKVIFLGGAVVPEPNSKHCIIYACAFDKTLRPLDTLKIEEEPSMPVAMTRFPGYDVLLLGCKFHIHVVQYLNGKLIKVKKLENIHSGYVADMCIRGRTLFSKGIEEPQVKQIVFQLPSKSPHENLSLLSSLPYQPSPTSQIPNLPPTSPAVTKPAPAPVIPPRQPTPPTVPYVKPIPPSAMDIDFLIRRPPPPTPPQATISTLPPRMPSNLSTSRPPPMAFTPIKYNEYNAAELIFDTTGNLEKLAISKNGTLIYAGGGTGCNLLKYDEPTRKYLQVKNDLIPKISAYGMKSTKSGHLLVQEPTTNDIVVYKSSGQEQIRYSAAVKFTFPVTHIRNPHFSGENDKVIWFSGTNEISIVDLTDLKMKDYKNFLPSMSGNKDSIALRGILRDDGRTILISFVLDNMFGLAYLHRGLIEPNVYPLFDILPSCSLYLTKLKDCTPWTSEQKAQIWSSWLVSPTLLSSQGTPLMQ